MQDQKVNMDVTPDPCKNQKGCFEAQALYLRDIDLSKPPLDPATTRKSAKGCPKTPNEGQRETKRQPKGTQGRPKGSQGDPKVLRQTLTRVQIPPCGGRVGRPKYLSKLRYKKTGLQDCKDWRLKV